MSVAASAGVASRRVAWQVLRRVNRDGAWTGPAIDRALRESGLDARDRAFAANLAFQTLRWQGTLDWALGQVVRRGLDEVEPDLLDVLRLGAWQLLYGQVPDRAAVATAVELGRTVLPARTVGFINGVLRALSRQRDELPWPPEDTAGGQALRLGYPEWIVEAARRRFGVDAGDELGAGNQPALLTVRARATDHARATLEAQGARVTAGRLAPEALAVDGITPGEITALVGDQAVIQDESSMVVGRTVAAVVGRSDLPVLDACAAPGGKTTHLVELGLQVVAADRNARRLRLVTDLAERLSLSIPAAAADGTDPPWRAETFAGVLIDAPCSGLGVVRRRPELRWRRAAADVPALAALQGRLLDASIRYVAPGGALVYSVCTWTVDETVDVVEAFLARTPGVTAEAVPCDLSSAAPGPGLQLGSALHGSDGMYIAVLRRSP